MSEPPTPHARHGRASRLVRLARKELSEILRDRRTVITLVLMPLLLYPLLSMAFQQFLLAGVTAQATPLYKVAIEDDATGNQLRDLLNRGNVRPGARAALVVGLPAAAGPLTPAGTLSGWYSLGDVPLGGPPHFRPASSGGSSQPEVLFYVAQDLDAAIRHGAAHVGVRAYRQGRSGKGPPLIWELTYQRTSADAHEVAAYLERQLFAGAAEELQAAIQTLRLPLDRAPLRVVRSPLGETADRRFTLAALVPLILILMTITGAVYPAIDLTAGERERGTLEILVAAPVPRLALLFAKYIAVVTVAVLTALVNLTMMTVTVQLSGLGRALFGDAGLTAPVLLALFALLLLFAAFFSAVLLALTSFARSFKEAQAYLIPLMLVSLAPGLAGMLPGLKLSGPYVVTPLLNIVLLARDLFDGTADPAAAAAVILSTLLYALVAIAVAARVFGSEGVLYGQEAGWSDLFRRPAAGRASASATGALLCLVLLFPLYFVLYTLLATADPGSRLWLQAGATFLLFVLVPIGAALWGRLRLANAFALRGGDWLAYPAAVLLGVGMVPLMYQLLTAIQAAGLTYLRPEQLQGLGGEVAGWRAYSAVTVVGSLALIGVLEEVFFRGYLLSALSSALSARAAIFASAVLFGAFHSVSSFDRMLPSTVAGLVLGWVCVRSGSLVPAMLLHACYNGLWVYLAYRGGRGEELSIGPAWLAAAAGGVALGALLLALRARPPESRAAPLTEG